jgi:cytochrome c peroxidase
MSKAKNSRHNHLPESEGFKDTRSVSSNKDSGQIASSRTLTSRLYKQIQLIVAKIAMMLGQLVSSWSKGLKRFSAISVIVVATILAGHTVSAQIMNPVDLEGSIFPVNPGPSQPLASLKTVSVPKPDNLTDFVQDNKTAENALIALGKSLFWDMQLGTDGIQSCASCHFHAGADSRSKNQINPGPTNAYGSVSKNKDGIEVFDIGGRPNYQLTAADYPFHKLSDVNDRSTVIADKNDITGSQGVFRTKFVDVNPGSDKDIVEPLEDKVFNVKGINVRQVTGRNSPTVINAVFNFRNFWDGRAQNIFNGVNEFGLRVPKDAKDPNPDTSIFKVTALGELSEVQVRLKNSSLASQAVGPPLSAFEAAAEGQPSAPRPGKDDTSDLSPTERLEPLELRKGRKLGKKLTVLRPLDKQLVATDDSILGSYSRGNQPGLNVDSYSKLIEQVFKPEWWNSNTIIQVDPVTGDRTKLSTPTKGDPLSTIQYTQMEYNFSLFFGLAVQAYESTLVSDNSPFDQYFDGKYSNSDVSGKSSPLSASQIRGLKVFQNQGKCINCHGGAEFTNASVKNVQDEKIERMRMGNGGVAVYDNGFYNIGVRPTFEDLGVGGKDPFGNPLSFTKYTQEQVAQGKIDAPILKAIPEEDIPEGPLDPKERAAVDGAFKVPGLRNVELTAPYFHNGGQATLEQVVEFYNRGGDFHEQNIDNLDADIQNLNLSAENKADLVNFLKSLTDERVRYDKAPFDHPQLFVPNGHPGDQNSVTDDGKGQATDQLLEIPAVGRNGGKGTPNFLATSLSISPIRQPVEK